MREDLSSTYASKSTAYYAGQVYDDKTQPITAAAATAGHWQALHEALRKRAAGLVEFNRTKGLPADRVAIYLYQGAAPDLSATKESIPNEGLLAVYDNTLTGEWRYCFGGTRSDAGRGGDLVRCVFDADGPTGAAYDLSAPAP